MWDHPYVDCVQGLWRKGWFCMSSNHSFLSMYWPLSTWPRGRLLEDLKPAPGVRWDFLSALWLSLLYQGRASFPVAWAETLNVRIEPDLECIVCPKRWECWSIRPVAYIGVCSTSQMRPSPRLGLSPCYHYPSCLWYEVGMAGAFRSLGVICCSRRNWCVYSAVRGQCQPCWHW